jgi:hypothetical protein
MTDFASGTQLAGGVLERQLDREVPRWREVNRDPRWLQWLAQRHELTAQPRQRLLDDATAQGDVRRIIALFHGFLAAYGNMPRQPQEKAAYRPPGKRTYTRADIVNMSKLRMQGRINDADWMRWEHELIAAGREGRIVGGVPLEKSG